MQAFAKLLDRLTTEPRQDAREQMLVRYFQEVPDPDRGFAVAVLTGELELRRAKPSLLKALIGERVDGKLIALSHDFVGDLAETVALLWPKADTAGKVHTDADCSLEKLVGQLEETGKMDFPQVLCGWMDRLDDTGRWALLKLLTGSLRQVVPAQLVKAAVARLGDLDPLLIEEAWHGSKPPHLDLFGWVEGRTGPPAMDDPALYRPVMHAQVFDAVNGRGKFSVLDFAFEWKWDGIRVQASSGRAAKGDDIRRLFNQSGDDISGSFPEIIEALTFDACIDGELLIVSEGKVQPYSDLQKRLNRSKPGPKLLQDLPATMRAYDLLVLDGEDLRTLPFRERRKRLENLLSPLKEGPIELSPLLTATDWESLDRARTHPHAFLESHGANAVDGVMLKHLEAPYVAGRSGKGWYKWQRDPHVIETVLMYAERGRGDNSSLYANFTVGVWRETEDSMELVPVGKAAFEGVSDELTEIDAFVRNNTIDRFGPVREVVHEAEKGVVLELEFESLTRSSRRKSGLAVRSPVILRLLHDKVPAEAGRLKALEALLPQ